MCIVFYAVPQYFFSTFDMCCTDGNGFSTCSNQPMSVNSHTHHKRAFLAYVPVILKSTLSVCSCSLYIGNSTSTILIATGRQDPTVHLTQYFFIAVAPPIFLANKN